MIVSPINIFYYCITIYFYWLSLRIGFYSWMILQVFIMAMWLYRMKIKTEVST
jgi:hypothetical protein